MSLLSRYLPVLTALYAVTVSSSSSSDATYHNRLRAPSALEVLSTAASTSIASSTASEVSKDETRQQEATRQLLDIAEFGKSNVQEPILKSLDDYFEPVIGRTFQQTLHNNKTFDPLVLLQAGDDFLQQHRGDYLIINSPCHENAIAKIDYNNRTATTLRGLGSVYITSIDMVPESFHDISFKGFHGATWNVTWNIQASFHRPLRIKIINATLHFVNPDEDSSKDGEEDASAFSCQGVTTTASIRRMYQDQQWTGMVAVEQPSLSITLATQGNTSNLVLFQSTSRVVHADIMALDFHFGHVRAMSPQSMSAATASSEMDGSSSSSSTDDEDEESDEATADSSSTLNNTLTDANNHTTLDLNVTVGELFSKHAQVLQVVMKDALQDAINEKLPFRPSSS
mgnify:CR=1 FL=1